MVVNAIFVIGERRVRQSDIGICGCVHTPEPGAAQTAGSGQQDSGSNNRGRTAAETAARRRRQQGQQRRTRQQQRRRQMTFDRTPRAVRRWVSGELAVPRHIALLVNLMLDTGTKPEELQP